MSAIVIEGIAKSQ